MAEHQGHPSGTSQGSRGQSQGSQSELQNSKFRAIDTHLTVCCMSVPKPAQRFFENVLFLFICLFQTTLLAPRSSFDWRTLTRPITSPLSLPEGDGVQGSRCTQTPKSLPTAGACSNSLRAGRPWALGLRLWTPGEGAQSGGGPSGLLQSRRASVPSRVAGANAHQAGPAGRALAITSSESLHRRGVWELWGSQTPAVTATDRPAKSAPRAWTPPDLEGQVSIMWG